MFGSLFGLGKKKKPKTPADDTLASARVGDVVVIGGFSPTFEDAYFLIEKRSRYEAETGGWHELIGVDGDRRVGIEFSDGDDGPFISVTEQRVPRGLSSVGLSSDQLIRMDEEHSLDNFVTYEGERYYYSNSREIYFFNDDQEDGVGFYGWEFINQDHQRMLSAVKWEGAPFEIYASVVVSPNIVNVYRNLP